MITSMAEDKLEIRILSDMALLIIAAVPIALFYCEVFTPFKRGYFCDDETIAYPYKDSTVTDCALYVGGLSIGILSILLCVVVERLFVISKDEGEYFFFEIRVPAYALHLYSSTNLLLFGAIIVEVAADFIKYTLGRLRPNFLDVCQSSFNCSSLSNPHTFVVNYTCTNPDTSSVDDSRLSFPSGHSSFSMFTMLFSVIHLQKYFICPHSKLLKPALQLILLLVGAYTMVSRICDNKHHSSDVIGGATLGFVTAVLMYCIPQRSYPSAQEMKAKEGVKPCANIMELKGSV